MSTTSEIIEKLKTLTLLEAAELVSQIEETFGVDASAPVGGGMVMAVGDAGGAAEEVAEKTTFDVVVEDIPSDKRVAVLKVIRKLTSLGLAEVKAFTNSLPGTLQEGISKEEAETAKTELEAAGAVVKIA
uniref:Large ribosomal subunit protein bL12c n=1 Tax=Oltmannsiellopsis viridis TaxID=51324 RepID=RK12_OLTVI|nr:ribosomal protein L12 [Oltmannsiellopsis viridis]Q20F00.1 RecName: Full=Large ribosomal subunit protein bL12c; AltName: Full=50S ribosomal protein L12, chloroplastic [Oltmannsiellopsis viridis]ABB82006.1 ribosomal protein L12 [Oltmannsiellopsis viridis]